MIVYKVGEKIKIKDSITALAVTLEKGAQGIVVALHSGRVEAAFEGLGIVSVDHNLIKKKVRKSEKLVKAKNVKMSDEVLIPGTGEYNKVGNIYRSDYDSADPSITVESVIFDSKLFGYNDLVAVRR